ncbi:MAG: ROK family protein [Phycisphaerales bacterium]|nr:ROK family protein [Phycisphaerales bacterium]
MTAHPTIGIDLGATHFHVGLVAPDGTIVARRFEYTHKEQGCERVIERLASCVRGTCAEAKIELEGVGGVGIGAPGSIDFDRGVVLEAPNIEWRDVALAPMLREQLGVPITIDNDVNCAVLGENTLGSGRNAPDALGVWVGTGVGGGIILNNRVYRGPLGTAGEIGRTVLFPDNPSGKRLMEENCSRAAVAAEIAHRNDLRESPSSSDIARAYEANDEVVRDIVDRAADLLGISIANTLSVMSIPLVLLGGGLAEALGEPYRARVERALRADVFPGEPMSHVEVRLTHLRENAGLLGAAMLARQSA